jgi:hypothetical protein
MDISHDRNLILGCLIKGDGLNSVGYGWILYQKTFRRALIGNLGKLREAIMLKRGILAAIPYIEGRDFYPD